VDIEGGEDDILILALTVEIDVARHEADAGGRDAGGNTFPALLPVPGRSPIREEPASADRPI
jgi:hypothetical protein